MSTEERKALREKAYGKPFRFNPRHWWIMEWIAEQPGTSMPDKLYRIVEAAYKTDYRRRGLDCMRRFYDRPNGMPRTEIRDLLSEAIGHFNRAGETQFANDARAYLHGLLVQIERGEP